MLNWCIGGNDCIMKDDENIKIKVKYKETYDIWKEIEDMQEVIEILFELLKEEHKKVNLLYILVGLLSVVTWFLTVGG